MIKRLGALLCSIGALIATFLNYSVLKARELSEATKAIADATNEAMKANNAAGATFYEYIGDFADSSKISRYFTTNLAAVLLVIAIICVGIVLTALLLAFIKNNGSICEVMEIKWISMVSFIAILLALLLGLIFPDLPEGVPSVFKFVGTVGIGTILFMVFTGITTVLLFLFNKE